MEAHHQEGGLRPRNQGGQRGGGGGSLADWNWRSAAWRMEDGVNFFSIPRGSRVAEASRQYLAAFILLWKLNNELVLFSWNVIGGDIIRYLKSGALLIARTIAALLASEYAKGNYKQARLVLYRVLQIGGVTGLALAATLFLGFGYLTLGFYGSASNCRVLEGSLASTSTVIALFSSRARPANCVSVSLLHAAGRLAMA
ncbi:hypothetical protein ZWY2020_041682 [Hordeum vulgare]|nr:hypothetical protein ZWY2020_041682 [Hordeum vulgare]